jgi:hypothetical protein
MLPGPKEQSIILIVSGTISLSYGILAFLYDAALEIVSDTTGTFLLMGIFITWLGIQRMKWAGLYKVNPGDVMLSYLVLGVSITSYVLTSSLFNGQYAAGVVSAVFILTMGAIISLHSINIIKKRNDAITLKNDALSWDEF